MTDLSSQILPIIKAHQIESLPLDQDMILPFYEGFSLVNLPCTITRLLGAPDFGKPPLQEEVLDRLGGTYEKVILLVVDAMGKDLFDQMLSPDKDLVWERMKDQAFYAPITSICPSTTASALTTLWTGEAPAAHGIIGYEMWSKEFGMVINNIHHSAASSRGDTGGLSRSGFDPHAFLSRPLLGTHLVKHGINPTTFIHSSIAHSGLSVMQMEDVDIQTFVDEADLCVSLAEYLNSRHGIREYVYVYYSDVDTLMHRYNAGNPRVSLQFEAFSHLFEKAFLGGLSTPVAKDTLLILVADHGSKITPKYPEYDLSRHPELMGHLVMQPTCENRLAFLYIKPGRMQAVQDYVLKTWPGDFLLVDPNTALDDGLFGEGPLKENVRERLGNLIIIARGDKYLWWAPKPNPMAGRHGGLSASEMLVPLFALPLG